MMRFLLMTGLLTSLLFLGPQALTAQTAEPAGTTTPPLSFSLNAFLAEVAQNNLEYAAQQYVISGIVSGNCFKKTSVAELFSMDIPPIASRTPLMLALLENQEERSYPVRMEWLLQPGPRAIQTRSNSPRF